MRQSIEIDEKLDCKSADKNIEDRFMRKTDKYIRKVLSGMHPASLFLYSYLSAIAVGTVLLMLPVSTVTGSIDFIDAVFTATSAVCVTGLIVVDTGSYFTLFGQMVILVMIQLGGLGIMTVSVAFFSVIGKKVLFRHRMAMQEIFSHSPREDIYRLVKSIFIFTALAELTGALLLALFWSGEFEIHEAVYLGLFHSVSAFCNAGFSLFSNSFVDYRGSIFLNFVICGLIIFGGLGFPVVYESYQKYFEKKEESRFRISVHTKTAVFTTGILIPLGMAVFWFTDVKHLGGESFTEIFLSAMFQSVTCRTAGFNTVDIAALNSSALTFMMFLMVVGASPGSCGGGVKTTTLALLASLSWARVKGRVKVTMFRKSIPEETVTRSITVVFLSMIIISIFFFLILVAQQDHGKPGLHGDFVPYLFETISAFGTVGLSTGATNTLTAAGKMYIIILMLIGRIGVVAFSYILTGRRHSTEIEYAEENMMIG